MMHTTTTTASHTYCTACGIDPRMPLAPKVCVLAAGESTTRPAARPLTPAASSSRPLARYLGGSWS